MPTKICFKCLEEKELTEFYKDFRIKGGYKNYCKQCKKLYEKNLNSNSRPKRIIVENSRTDKTKSYKDSYCCICTNERLNTSRYCIRCLIAQTVKKFLLSPKESTELISALIEKFYKNEASCFYTGLPLVLGLNASIDHRVPKAKGGTNQINNLEWVHVSINNLKRDRTEKEFIAAYGSMLVEYNLLASKGVI